MNGSDREKTALKKEALGTRIRGAITWSDQVSENKWEKGENKCMLLFWIEPFLRNKSPYKRITNISI